MIQMKLWLNKPNQFQKLIQLVKGTLHSLIACCERKPNASILSLEAMVLFSNNKTAKWLSEKDPVERVELLKKARDCAPEFKRQCQAWKKKLLEEWANLLQAKQAALARLQQKSLQEKENLTQAIMEYGLWQTKQQVEEGLAKLKSKTSKLQAVKTQLDFWRSFGTKSCRQNHISPQKNKRKLNFLWMM